MQPVAETKKGFECLYVGGYHLSHSRDPAMRPVGLDNGLDYSIGGVACVSSAVLARDASDFQEVEAKKRQ